MAQLALDHELSGVVIVNSNVAEFFDHLTERVYRASRAGCRTFDILLGGHRVRLFFAGDRLLEQLWPAVRHIEAPSGGTPVLCLHAWEGSLNGSGPEAPWRPEAIAARGVIAGFNTPRFHTAFNPDSGALSALDATTAQGFFWTPDADRLAAYEKAAPFRTLLTWSVQSWGGQMAHASAVAGPAGAALVVGPGGAGKSTVALGCWGSGLTYLGDDYCTVLPDADGGFLVASLYATAKLEAEHLRKLHPSLALKEPPSWAKKHPKVILPLDGELRSQGRSAKLAAVVVPKIVEQLGCELEECRPAEALAALAPSSIFQAPLLGQEAFAFYARLVARTPCFRLRLGRTMGDIAGRMKELLQHGTC